MESSNKTVAFLTLGCKVNTYETEAVEELLKGNGYNIGKFEEYADVYIVNTCTVTAMSDKKSRQMIRRTRKLNPSAVVVVMGCYSQKAPNELLAIEEVNLVLGTSNRKAILKEIEDISSDDKRIIVEDIMKIRDFEELEISEVRDRARALVKIQDGCDRFCSYCIIPFTRGPIRSRKLENIIEEVKRIVENGYKEVVLTGIHVASYGKDTGGISLIDVIEGIAKIDGLERIRTSSVEPLIITEEFVKRLGKIEEFCPHFHLSLQSGSDTVLSRMNRRYTSAEYKDAVQTIRKIFPFAAITTDVIVGFPEETDQEFQETYEFLQELKLYETHIFKYSPRNGTKAAEMPDQVAPSVKSHRSELLIKLNEKNKKDFEVLYLGQNADVLIETWENGYSVGHTKNYVKTGIKTEENLVNQVVACKISAISKDFVIAQKS
ncbi:tRNA (N(6)-L-threonylcarbamoyladenosine(37)-C(2))-methylthiotransferase MtaB [Proteocatella sphenisci]|uniref:tRNA (N(6)-L-threonylcarbamoyladenosine(37)-C(2))- methylthiotransferase MtaB n=1 Tax=Proteocatella sphenisci TaxID=181070 RepID=UPI0004B210DD|nr:tRNA (N(6)-L-threonylcarbamoyladenosine(37)-C(2))-methylthiotransferase MtaB [Proteocatella sphenisci]